MPKSYCRRPPTLIKLLAGAVCALLACAQTTKPVCAAEMAVEQLLASVQKTLIRVRDQSDDKELPPLKKVTLLVRAALAQKAGGKLSLVVLEVGSNASKETIQEIELELRPPGSEDKAKVSDEADALAAAIVEAAHNVKTAENGTPPLHLRTLTAKLQFVVKKEGAGGLNFTLAPVTLSLGGEVKGENTQSIILVFGGS